MKHLGRWLAETRAGRTTFRLSAAGFVALFIYLVVYEEVGRQTREITQRIEVIEQAEPADLIRECLRTPECRRLLTRRGERGGERGDRLQPAPAGQPPKPGEGPGDHGNGKDATGEKPPQQVPHKPPNSGLAPPIPSIPPVLPQPGNSGDTPALDRGIKACVELAVSACVEADAPQLLP